MKTYLVTIKMKLTLNLSTSFLRLSLWSFPSRRMRQGIICFSNLCIKSTIESVGAKVEEYDVLRLPPTSPVPETSSMLPYEMQDLQNHEYLSNIDKFKSKAKQRDIGLDSAYLLHSSLSFPASNTLLFSYDAPDELHAQWDRDARWWDKDKRVRDIPLEQVLWTKKRDLV